MVYLAALLGYVKKSYGPPRKFLRSGFLDLLPVKVKSGSGGCGLPKYGGIGGRGGNIFVRAKEGVDLTMVSKNLKGKLVVAGPGFNSDKKGIIGKVGNDVVIDVPPGVVVRTSKGINLGEVNEPGSTLLVAKGGVGGNPDNGFCGQKGQRHTLMLDLKLIADVALVGFPNAGKSTLLKAVSGAKTKIASYPFTTIKPHLGMMTYEDDRMIKMADLPGLIEGAHVDIGMGHKFLKHLERCKMMLFVVDVQGFQLSYKYDKRSCLDTIVLLNKEIELYKPDLLDTPAMLMINKMDTDGAQETLEQILPQIENLEEYVETCDETARPERVVKFRKILTTALIDSTEESVTEIKNDIRNVLDDVEASRNCEEDQLDAEVELYRKLKGKMTMNAPGLV